MQCSHRPSSVCLTDPILTSKLVAATLVQVFGSISSGSSLNAFSSDMPGSRPKDELEDECCDEEVDDVAVVAMLSSGRLASSDEAKDEGADIVATGAALEWCDSINCECAAIAQCDGRMRLYCCDCEVNSRCRVSRTQRAPMMHNSRGQSGARDGRG